MAGLGRERYKLGIKKKEEVFMDYSMVLADVVAVGTGVGDFLGHKGVTG